LIIRQYYRPFDSISPWQTYAPAARCAMFLKQLRGEGGSNSDSNHAASRRLSPFDKGLSLSESVMILVGADLENGCSALRAGAAAQS
jgi:hypothetical protein